MSNLVGVFGIVLVILMMGAWLTTMLRSRQRDEAPPPIPSQEADLDADPDRDEIAEAIARWDKLQTRRGRSQFWE